MFMFCGFLTCAPSDWIRFFPYEVIRIMFLRLTSLTVLVKYKEIKFLGKMGFSENRYFFSSLIHKTFIKDLLVNSPVFSILCLLFHVLLIFVAAWYFGCSEQHG